MRRLLPLVFLLLLATDPAVASETHVHDRSPYSGQQSRAIKALSDRQIAELKSGAGMALSLPAELNRHPGPRHVLELAERLELTPAQRAAAETIGAEMSSAARSLGERIIAGEQALDRRFAHGRADEADIAALAAEIASLWGELRAVHLIAHLRMTRELSPRQIARYDAARGY